MRHLLPIPTFRRSGPRACLTALLLALAACGELPPPSNLPPNASDLPLLKTVKLCDRQEFVRTRVTAQPQPWGTGEEWRVPKERSGSKAEESLFFNQDGVLVGVLFIFPGGLKLDAYPVLTDTLHRLPPITEFYVNVAGLASRGDFTSSRLFRTGDEKSTTEYLVLGDLEAPTLLMASMSVDPYLPLVSVHRREYLARIEAPSKPKPGAPRKGPGSEDKQPFPVLEQFARGEAAQLGYCGGRNFDTAVEAYSKAIALGIQDPAHLSEAHHKLGLAFMGKGDAAKARDELILSLQTLPKRPDVLNNLGEAYRKLGDLERARAAFERAVMLKPNYPIARFNLAEVYEPTNPKLAINEYETYLAIAEGIPEEEERVKKARGRVELLKRP